MHSVLCQHQVRPCHKVLVCTALARMLSWSCISVHSVLGQHQVCPCHEVLVCTAVAGLVDSSSTDCLHSTHEPQEGEPFGVVLMNSESFRVLRSCFEFRRIVNASRIPPRPLAGQRLEDAGQQLEAWKTPQESSWRRLRASNLSPGELLESSWRLPEPSWRLLESLRGILGALEAVLESSWEVLGRSWRRIRGVLNVLWVVLEPSWELWKPCWSHLEAKRLPKRRPKGPPIELQDRLEPKTVKP